MKTIISLAAFYLFFLVILTLFQRKFIYFPYKLDKEFEYPRYVSQLEEIFITCENKNTINGLYAPGKDTFLTVLIFHGNAGNITHRDIILQGFNRLGYAVLLIDYQGYGKSEGTPSEKNLYLDGKASLEWLGKEKKVKPTEIVLFGKSLGSGVAVELATKDSFKGLILESPFTSIASVARSHFPYKFFPVSLLLIDKFDNASKIHSVDSPLLITHGTEDTIVNKKEGEKLFKKANMPKELYLIEGADHNDIQYYNPQNYWATIAEWLEGLK
ncbi:alpha/beta hydrolase [bacterium]|nr:MAG: alpha/beta hydrolase [bacterium]